MPNSWKGRAPSLDQYDTSQLRPRRYGAKSHLPEDLVFGGFDESGASEAMLLRFIGADDWEDQQLIRFLWEKRTHASNKALLIAYGVNGEVPLTQAMANAGLAANDNDLRAAEAAA